MSEVVWGIVYYKASDGSVPAEDFLDSCPVAVEAKLMAVLEQVRQAPPPQFSGGGMWEAMHGAMRGYYEIRVTGAPGRSHYRLFCILENGDPEKLQSMGYDAPQIAVITGMVKKNATLFTDAVYRRQVRDLGEDHHKQFPRRIAGN